MCWCRRCSRTCANVVTLQQIRTTAYSRSSAITTLNCRHCLVACLPLYAIISEQRSIIRTTTTTTAAAAPVTIAARRSTAPQRHSAPTRRCSATRVYTACCVAHCWLRHASRCPLTRLCGVVCARAAASTANTRTPPISTRHSVHCRSTPLINPWRSSCIVR